MWAMSNDFAAGVWGFFASCRVPGPPPPPPPPGMLTCPPGQKLDVFAEAGTEKQPLRLMFHILQVHLPRQARDAHTKSSNNRGCFALGDNGSCDCDDFCASGWTGKVKATRPDWSGATSAIANATTVRQTPFFEPFLF